MTGFVIGCAVLSAVFVILGLIGDAWQKCNGSVTLSPEREEQP